MEYVYFFRETGRPYVKIGMSKNDIQVRFQSFKTFAPLGAYIVGYIKTNDCAKLEKKIHEKYKDKRLQGEFFNLTDDEIYIEINLHDSKFGEIVFLVDQLVNFHCIDVNQLKKDLLEKANIVKEIELKYKPNDILLNFLEKNKGQYYTNNMILEKLNDLGCIISQYTLGITLKNLGYIKKRKRMSGISAIVYKL